MRRYAIALIVCCAPMLGSAASLTDVRIWEAPDQTRVVLDLSDATAYSIFTLDNPHRVVVDLSNAVQSGNGEFESRGMVSGVRLGQRSRSLRVVLDVSRALIPQSYLLQPSGEYGHRLVVELPHGASNAPDPILSLAEKDIVVAIDPGHGGEDPGATGPGGVREKDVALAIAQRLKKLIDAEPHMHAVLTREGDYFVPLRKRMERAQLARADLFISIHADAFSDRRVHGSSVYILSPRGASSEHARVLADRENAADLIGGVEIQNKDDLLASVLLDISQSAAIEASLDLGGRMLSELKDLGKLHKSSVQRAGFAVLKAPDVPSILVETAFISNQEEERRLRSPRHQQDLAQGLRNGILSYFETYRPQRVVAQVSQ